MEGLVAGAGLDGAVGVLARDGAGRERDVLAGGLHVGQVGQVAELVTGHRVFSLDGFRVGCQRPEVFSSARSSIAPPLPAGVYVVVAARSTPRCMTVAPRSSSP